MYQLSELNLQQQQAVTAGLGPVLVLAGPGSGKTRVLTHRIEYLIDRLGVRPYNILAVTFTNKAALEMRSRVEKMLGEQAQGLTLGTFHATCVRILRREAEHLPINANFVIFDTDDQVSLVKRALADLDLDEKKFRAPGVLGSISRAKNELVLPDEFPVQTYRDEVVKRVYQRYQEMLAANNAVDFDDLLVWVAYLMEEIPSVREKYAQRYEHVLVDEFQDTNMVQYILLKHLASFHGNIFVVGDIDQSIYRWRGADYRNILRFERDFPATQVILLEQNYRSTQSILNAAMAVIDQNPNRKQKILFTERGAGAKVIYFEADDERVEASFIVEEIAKLVGRKTARPGDCAVMYRTNAQSRVLEEAFLHAGLPYKLVGAQRFYGRREIKDVVAYLRLIHNPNDEISLERIINVPTRGIGSKTWQALLNLARQNGVSPCEILLDLGKDISNQRLDLPNRVALPLTKFGSLLVGWRTLAPGMPPLKLMDRVLEDVDYQSYTNDGTDEGESRWENVLELRRLAAEFSEQPLEAFLERVALVSDQDTIEATASVPTLLTLHAAKGLEFPVVFIAGLDEGTLPHSRSFEDPEELLEECRLLYVGMTRAKDLLYLVYPSHRNTFGFSEATIPSRFLEDLPPDILEDRAGGRSGYSPRRLSRRQPAPDRWSNQGPAYARILEQRYHPGARVVHPVWGEGLVLNSSLQDDDEVVDIFFEDIGLKRVAASLAKLELKA